MLYHFVACLSKEDFNLLKENDFDFYQQISNFLSDRALCFKNAPNLKNEVNHGLL